MKEHRTTRTSLFALECAVAACFSPVFGAINGVLFVCLAMGATEPVSMLIAGIFGVVIGAIIAPLVAVATAFVDSHVALPILLVGSIVATAFIAIVTMHLPMPIGVSLSIVAYCGIVIAMMCQRTPARKLRARFGPCIRCEHSRAGLLPTAPCPECGEQPRTIDAIPEPQTHAPDRDDA